MSTATHAHTDALADALIDPPESGIDMLEVLGALKPLLRSHDFDALCGAIEVCPTHLCDAAICADDAADCEAGHDH